ncbi:MAG: extracellular solute-binding protein [Lachnospiraceae bacterium]|nr:extracellular solute-binding protein [Lachnospiraceae bacterium]
MKKKLLAVLLAGAMTVSMLTACGSSSSTTESSSSNSTSGESTSGESSDSTTSTGAGETITIWVADAVTSLTQTMAEEFMADNGYEYTIVVESVGEGDAASNMITDVEGGADIFGFAQDQLARLVSAGAVQQLTGTGYDTTIEEENGAGSVAAATFGSTLYAFPMSADNGYFLYYDSSVVTDPTSLEQIVADCEAAGKNFYFEINSGWYQVAFFFGTGCTLTYETNDDGTFASCNIDYASDAGLVALKEIIELQSSSAFQNGSSLSSATNVGAIVDGTWDSDAAKELFGDNYAAAALPSFTGSDGETYQLSSFSGYKLLGVKPQTDAAKLKACLELAQYLTSEECQLERFNEVGWGPSNLAAQEDEAVQADVALSALAEQSNYSIGQGQYPDDYWTLATALGDDIIAGNITSSTSDDDLMTTLEDFETKCISYAQ